LDYPYDSEEVCAADDESDTEHNNGIEDSECPEQQDVSAAANVPGLVHPTRKSNRQAEKVLVMVNAVAMRRYKGGKKQLGRMCQWFTRMMYLDREFQLEMYYE
jgi:hypothetical protein